MVVPGAQLEAQLNAVIVIVAFAATLLGRYSEKPKASPWVAVSSKQSLVPHEGSVHIC